VFVFLFAARRCCVSHAGEIAPVRLRGSWRRSSRRCCCCCCCRWDQRLQLLEQTARHRHTHCLRHRRGNGNGFLLWNATSKVRGVPERGRIRCPKTARKLRRSVLATSTATTTTTTTFRNETVSPAVLLVSLPIQQQHLLASFSSCFSFVVDGCGG